MSTAQRARSILLIRQRVSAPTPLDSEDVAQETPEEAVLWSTARSKCQMQGGVQRWPVLESRRIPTVRDKPGEQRTGKERSGRKGHRRPEILHRALVKGPEREHGRIRGCGQREARQVGTREGARLRKRRGILGKPGLLRFSEN